MAFNWSPGIGDPTPLGWTTIVLYALAVSVCLLSSRRDPARGAAADRQIWTTLAVLLLVLGINKQLDLQSALTEIGRLISRYGGWYEHRRVAQILFVAMIGGVATAGACVAFWRTRGAATSTRVALAGAVLLLGYVVIRAASFHHVDGFISSTLLSFRWNWLLEIGGLVVIIAAGLRRLGWASTDPNLR